MASRLLIPAVLAASLLVACKTQADPTSLKGISRTEGDTISVAPEKPVTPGETSYTWNYPVYPNNYYVEPLRRDFASGRSIGENGSLAGPWLEGAEAKELPVGQPNVRRGQRWLQQLGGAVTDAMRPKLSDTPFQAYLKLKQGLEGKTLGNAPITRDQLWDLTFYLYTTVEPDFGKSIPVRLDPSSVNNPSKQKNGSQIFGSNCAMCHGSDGWGRGHSGMSLQPPPANFHEPRRLYNRSDEQLYTVLKDGIYGTAMPPWADKLSDQEIHWVIGYVRSFSYSTEDIGTQGGASPAPQVRGGNENSAGPGTAQGGATGGSQPTGTNNNAGGNK